jgi:CheY-like chemotaxis protein
LGPTTETPGSVLIVEDDDDLAAAIADLVAFEGHEARVARHGGEGLDRIYERRPDLILLDIRMPVLDGPAMVRRLAPFEAKGQAIPIVLVSGLRGLETIAARLGTPYFLRKPFEAVALIELVATALRSRRGSRDRPSEL